MKLGYVIVGIALLVGQISYAQNKKSKTEASKKPINNKVAELKIGDKMPELNLFVLNEGIIKEVKFSDFNQSLVIIDFWDTYCTSCIESMPKVQKLQKEFGNQILILPVTYQDASLVKSFFNTNRFLKSKGVKLPSVVNDKLLDKYFKHRGVPHVVWIYKGIVTAITNSAYVTTEHIKNILHGEAVKWPVKNDFLVYDYDNNPLIKIDQTKLMESSSLRRYAIVTGYMKEIPRKFGSVIDTISKTVRDYNFNSPIIDVYYNAMSMVKPFPFWPVSNRIILEVKDKGKYFHDPTKMYEEDWNMKNVICFESIVSDTTTAPVRGKMIVEQLNRLLNLNGRLEKRKVNCLIITKIGKHVLEDADTTAFFNDRPVSELINWLNTSNLIKNQYPTIVDETDYEGTLSLNEWKDIDSLRIELQRSGFDLKEDDREIEMFVLTEKN